MADILKFVQKEKPNINPVRLTSGYSISEIGLEPGMNVSQRYSLDVMNHCIDKIVFNDRWNIFIEGRQLSDIEIHNLVQNKEMPWFSMPTIRSSEMYSFSVPKILSLNNTLKKIGLRKDLPTECKTIEARVLCASTTNINTAVYLFDDKNQSLYLVNSKQLRS